MRHFLTVSVFTALLVFLARMAVSGAPYLYDEADYMYATKLGLVANYTDTPTMPFTEFLRTGLNRGMLSQTELSQLIRGSNDVLFYRHWDGPLYFYGLMLISRLRLNEHGMRLFNLLFVILSLLVIYLGCIWVFGGTQGTLAAVFASELFAWSATTIRSTELAPHQAFVCCYLACLILLAKTVATGNRKYFYCAVVVAALSCCLLEVGFVVVASVIVCGYLERESLRANRAFVLRSLLAFIATALVVWPGAILKLSFVKGYLFMAYLSQFRKFPWGPEGFVTTWERRLFTSPVEWLVIGVSLLTWVFLRRFKSNPRALYPLAEYGALMLAATIGVTTGTLRYSLVFQPALDVLAGCILAAYLMMLRRSATAYALTAILGLVLFTETWVNLKRQPVVDDPRLSSLLAYIRENHLECSRLLVPQDDLPTLHYYFPKLFLRGYKGNAPQRSSLRDAPIDGLLHPGFPIQYEPYESLSREFY